MQYLQQCKPSLGLQELIICLSGVTIFPKVGYKKLLLDPRTGYPTETFSSVTGITKEPSAHMILSTSLFVMGKEEFIAYLSRLRGVSVILIDLEGKMYVSADLKGRIRLLEKVDIH